MRSSSAHCPSAVADLFARACSVIQLIWRLRWHDPFRFLCAEFQNQQQKKSYLGSKYFAQCLGMDEPQKQRKLHDDQKHLSSFSRLQLFQGSHPISSIHLPATCHSIKSRSRLSLRSKQRCKPPMKRANRTVSQLELI
jgi:hypothetical protein